MQRRTGLRASVMSSRIALATATCALTLLAIAVALAAPALGACPNEASRVGASASLGKERGDGGW